MTKKRKAFIIITACIVVAILSSFFVYSYFRNNQAEFNVPIALSDGFEAKIPLPDKTRHIGRNGLGMDKFKCMLSENEINEFYKSYFDSLKKCYYKHDKERIVYYDSVQKIVVDVKVSSNEDGNYFFISYDSYDSDTYIQV